MFRMLMFAGAGAALLGVAAVGAWIAVAWTVETPPYAVAQKDGAIELRDYPALRVAEIDRTGPRYDALREGFRPLAGYIFARERPGAKIAMTAPVTQIPEGEGRWAVQFIMPQSYALSDLPAPAGSSVRLREMPAQRMAAIRFSGVATDEGIAAKEQALRTWLERRGLSASGAPVYAYYNDPLTPGFLRRNEVLIPVADAPSA